MSRYLRRSGALTTVATACLPLVVAIPARADINVEGGGGYGYGQLSTDGSITFQTIPLSFHCRYQGGLWKVIPYSLGVAIHNHIISYQDAGIAYTGSDFLAGLTLGTQMATGKSSYLRLEAGYYPENTVSVASESAAVVNGATYRHSTLTTLTGPGAASGSVALVFENREGQFNKYERVYYGLQASALSQPLTRMETDIATSNRSLAPDATEAVSGSYALRLAYLSVLVGFAF